MTGEVPSKPVSQDGKQENAVADSPSKKPLRMDTEETEPTKPTTKPKNTREKKPRAEQKTDTTKKASANKTTNAQPDAESVTPAEGKGAEKKEKTPSATKLPKDVWAAMSKEEQNAHIRANKPRGAKPAKPVAPNPAKPPASPKKTNRQKALEQAAARAAGLDPTAVVPKPAETAKPGVKIPAEGNDAEKKEKTPSATKLPKDVWAAMSKEERRAHTRANKTHAAKPAPKSKPAKDKPAAQDKPETEAPAGSGAKKGRKAKPKKAAKEADPFAALFGGADTPSSKELNPNAKEFEAPKAKATKPKSAARAKPDAKAPKASKTSKPSTATEPREPREVKAKATGTSKEARPKAPRDKKQSTARPKDGAAGEGMSAEELKNALHAEVDELFQFENLSKNLFLLSKMNQYMYIPVNALQKHTRIRALTTKHAALLPVLKSNRSIIISSDFKLVRPNLATQRTVLILRNLPSGTTADDVKQLFAESKSKPGKVRCEVADNWFLHFESAEETLTAYEHIKDNKVDGKPIAARIKSVNMPVLFNRSAFRSNIVPPNSRLAHTGTRQPYERRQPQGSGDFPSTPLNPNAKEFELGKDYEISSSSTRPQHAGRGRGGGRGDGVGGKGLGRGAGKGSGPVFGGRGGSKQPGHGQPQSVELADKHFMHVRERHSGGVRCEVGPQILHLTADENVARPPQPFIDIPVDHFCVVRNPVRKDAFGNVLLGEKDKLKLRYGDKDVRLHSYGSFALYPGEQLVEPVQRMQQVPEGQALQLRALRAFLDKSAYLANPMWRVSGDTWLFMGPAQYLPHAEAEVVGLVTPIVVAPNTALELTATNDFIDNKSGKLRNKGDVWLVRQAGPFLPGLDEEVVRVRTGHDVTITEALHVRAETALVDAFGIQRSAGDEWLVTTRNKIVYIPEINEAVIGPVQPTHVSHAQYCVLEDVVKEDDLIVRHRKVVQGDKKFFLQPNQRLIEKPMPKLSIKSGEALLLKVIEPFMDEQTVQPHSSLYMSAHLAVVFALVAYLVTQPWGSMFSGSSIVLALGTLLLSISLFVPRSAVQVVERLPGQEYLVHGPLDSYVPSAQVEQLGKKRAVLHIPALGIHSLYWADKPQP